MLTGAGDWLYSFGETNCRPFNDGDRNMTLDESDEMVHRNIISEQIEREHGETIGELRDLEEVVGVVDRVTGLARNELHEIIGCSSEIFADIARVGEAGEGELPFRVETREIDGQT